MSNGVFINVSTRLFGFLGIFASFSHWLNPRTLLLESNGLENYFVNTEDEESDRVEEEDDETQIRKDKEKWKRKSLLYHLVAIGGDSQRNFWIGVYILCVVFFLLIALAAAIDQHEQSTGSSFNDGYDNTKMTLIQDYEYEPEPHLPYPTCQLKKGFGGYETSLGDFAFLSGIAYSRDNWTSFQLQTWFGLNNINATNDDTAIENFKLSPEYTEEFEDFGTAVSYKLITFNGIGAAVTIRGTSTVFDVIADAQLWVRAEEISSVEYSIFSIAHHISCHSALSNALSGIEVLTTSFSSVYTHSTPHGMSQISRE